MMREHVTPYFVRGVGTATVKAAPGRVYEFTATNRNASARYLQLYDQASGAPSGTTNCIGQWVVPAGGAISVGADAGARGQPFAAGITYGWSTSGATYTAATASDHDLMMEYV